MFKASDLVSFCEAMLGMPYWYGCCVYNCTEALMQRKAKQYPEHYKSARISKYKEAAAKNLVCTDCVGLVKGFFWTNGGEGVLEAIGTGKAISNKYGSNGCPDRSANGMLSWCKSQGAKHGEISTLPDVPGILLFAPGHVGVYIGGGKAIEARGFNYGIVKTKVSERKWTSWAYMPKSLLEYDTASEEAGATEQTPTAPGSEKTEREYKLGDRLIKKGVCGADVAELQTLLVELGYDIGSYGEKKNGVDGECGAKTVVAIKSFQREHGLSADGEYGSKSHTAMINVMAGRSEAQSFEILVTGGSVNIRTQPNTTQGKVVRVAHAGDKLMAQGIDKQSGWFRLSDGCYISSKYAKPC